MNHLGSFKEQLRSVIQWDNPGSDALFYRWSESGDEIKNCSKLIVGPGQGCIFVYEGQVQEVHVTEGLFTLETANIPFWTTLTKVMQAFQSENKVGIYFFRTAKILDQKWGTISPIKYEDPKYQFPVGLRAFGNYSFRIADPKSFFVNVVSVTEQYRISDFRQVMGSRIIQPLTDHFAESGYSYSQIDVQREELAQGIHRKIECDFSSLGFIITDFRIEGTSFDEDTMRRINRIADIKAEALAAASAGVDYTRLQQLEAMRDAAKNESGLAGMGVGMGAGVALGQSMTSMISGTQAAAPAESATIQNTPALRLQKLKQMLDIELITQEEFNSKKQEILREI